MHILKFAEHTFLTGFRLTAQLFAARDPQEMLAVIRAADDRVAGSPLNALYFRRHLIERALRNGDWALATAQADILEREAGHVLYAAFVAERGRALAAWGRGERGPELRAELALLRERAHAAGVRAPFPDA